MKKKAEKVLLSFVQPLVSRLYQECDFSKLDENEIAVINEVLDSSVTSLNLSFPPTKKCVCMSYWDGQGKRFQLSSLEFNDAALDSAAEDMSSAVGEDAYQIRILTLDGKMFDLIPQQIRVQHKLEEV